MPLLLYFSCCKPPIVVCVIIGSICATKHNGLKSCHRWTWCVELFNWVFLTRAARSGRRPRSLRSIKASTACTGHPILLGYVPRVQCSISRCILTRIRRRARNSLLRPLAIAMCDRCEGCRSSRVDRQWYIHRVARLLCHITHPVQHTGCFEVVYASAEERRSPNGLLHSVQERVDRI